jgi:hypothetical protein
VLVEVLSLGPAVTAGIVDEDAAATVSALDFAAGRHPKAMPAANIIETLAFVFITCSE